MRGYLEVPNNTLTEKISENLELHHDIYMAMDNGRAVNAVGFYETTGKVTKNSNSGF